jgi:hypothetical protein
MLLLKHQPPVLGAIRRRGIVECVHIVLLCRQHVLDVCDLTWGNNNTKHLGYCASSASLLQCFYGLYTNPTFKTNV